MVINLDIALELIAAVRKKAKEIGVPMVIAVVDSGGNLISQQRMEMPFWSVSTFRSTRHTLPWQLKCPLMSWHLLLNPDSPFLGFTTQMAVEL